MLTYIVIANNNYWGKDADLRRAFLNASLPDVTSPAEFFCDRLEADDCSWDSMGEDWEDYGKMDADWRDHDKIAFTLYRFDDDFWNDFEISNIDGSVTFYPQSEHGLSKEELQEKFDKCITRGFWQGGFITEREEGQL